MRWAAVILPAAVSASVVERQAAPAKGPIVTELKPQIRPDAKRHLLRMGPYTLSAANTMNELSGQMTIGSVSKGLCNNLGTPGSKAQDCTMLGGKVGVVYADGKEATPANGIYIHHILSSIPQKKEVPWVSTCGNPNRKFSSVNSITGGTGFLSNGEDSAGDQAMFVDKQGQMNTGYHMKAGQTVSFWAQLVNKNKTPAQVYVTFEQEWLPGIIGNEASTIVLSATCGGGMIKMGNGQPTPTKSGKFSIMTDGRILGGRGHIHDGGVKMNLYINGKSTCSSDAVYGDRGDGGMGAHGGHGGKKLKAREAQAPGPKAAKGGDDSKKYLTIASMKDCTGPFKVKKGDYIQIESIYDLGKHPLRTTSSGAKAGADIMGMMGVLFAYGAEPMTMRNGTVID